MSEAAFQRPSAPAPATLRHVGPRQLIGNPGISDRIRSEQVIGFDRNPQAIADAAGEPAEEMASKLMLDLSERVLHLDGSREEISGLADAGQLGAAGQDFLEQLQKIGG